MKRIRKEVISLVVAMGIVAFNSNSFAMSGDYALPESIKDKYNAYVEIEKKVNDTNYNTPRKTTPTYRIDYTRTMPEKHLSYLRDLTTKRGLNFTKTLAVLKHESQYNHNIIAVNDYGYMQINKQNHTWLSGALNTKNDPLDPYINMNWGTYMLKNHYDYWRMRGISAVVPSGEVFSPLDRYVLSSYNKGIAGFVRNGEAVSYINKVSKEYRLLISK